MSTRCKFPAETCRLINKASFPLIHVVDNLVQLCNRVDSNVFELLSLIKPDSDSSVRRDIYKQVSLRYEFLCELENIIRELRMVDVNLSPDKLGFIVDEYGEA